MHNNGHGHHHQKAHEDVKDCYEGYVGACYVTYSSKWNDTTMSANRPVCRYYYGSVPKIIFHFRPHSLIPIIMNVLIKYMILLHIRNPN